MRKLAPLALVAAALSLSGCVQRIMDFTVISSKNVDIPGIRGEKVSGEDMKSIVIVFPTGQPSIKAAVDQALEKGNGDVLLDGVISSKMWYIPYVYGQAGFVVEGTSMHTYATGTAPAPRRVEVASTPGARKRAMAEPVPAPDMNAAVAAAPVAAAGDPDPAPASAPAADVPAPPRVSALDADAPPPAQHAARPKLTTAEAAAELLP
jgi:hypothetical protein